MGVVSCPVSSIEATKAYLNWLVLDPPCLYLQEVVSEVQGDESNVMHTLAGILYMVGG